ncbi:unnamed protein product, partial [Onchocerca ochengi]
GTVANMNSMLNNATGLASASTFDSAALYQAQASTLTQQNFKIGKFMAKIFL